MLDQICHLSKCLCSVNPLDVKVRKGEFFPVALRLPKVSRVAVSKQTHKLHTVPA